MTHKQRKPHTYITETSKLPLIISNPSIEQLLPLMTIFLILFFKVTKYFHWDKLSSFSPGHRCSLHLLTSSPVPSHCCPVIAAPWQVLIRLSQPPSQDLEHPLQWPHWFHWPLAERNASWSMAVAYWNCFKNFEIWGPLLSVHFLLSYHNKQAVFKYLAC